MINASNDGQFYTLTSPTLIPKATGFLWNEKMMIQCTCRGYAVAQFMQPEPAKYSHAPNLEGKTFMQPEQEYYTHHPGRFVYVKNEQTNEIFSAPHEPVRKQPTQFAFSVGKDKIIWNVENDGIQVEMCLCLTKQNPVELWQIKIKNKSAVEKKISVYPYFTVGNMSWMNQSGEYNEKLQSIICSSVTPYQKYKDYYTIKNFAHKTFLLAEQKPSSWEVCQEAFEGEGGLHNPSAIQEELLGKGDSRYENPVCVMQYRLNLNAGEEQNFRFVFGAAVTEKDIQDYREKFFLNSHGFQQAIDTYEKYIADGTGCLQIKTPDSYFDNFVNHWLPRQVYYHGVTNRLSTDPQTRNFLQDNMGMSYIKPEITRNAFLLAVSQQHENGAMPDGILLYKGAELKYINQVPHTDHCVWLPICISAYLDETNDYSILDEMVVFIDSDKKVTVFEHITRAVNWLIKDRNEKGLNYINQGDWCDPMNMVGYKGKGVSGWLTIATAYASIVWANICQNVNKTDEARTFIKIAKEINTSINTYLWDGQWYARGITDDNVIFGVSKDKEGRIFINPQGWALLSGAADEDKKKKLMTAVEENLESPYGVEKLAPAYITMREDVGRVTQKHPGSAENGAVYNHAAAFYIFALYDANEKEKAYDLLRKMLPGPDLNDIVQRGQLPVFIPNYYRGAYRQFPRVAGRSSHLFNTGTASWVYRCIIEGLFGLKGSCDGLMIQPQLPDKWQSASVKRYFRGAIFNIDFIRENSVCKTEVYVDGRYIEDGIVRDINLKSEYNVLVKLPVN